MATNKEQRRREKADKRSGKTQVVQPGQVSEILEKSLEIGLEAEIELGEVPYSKIEDPPIPPLLLMQPFKNVEAYRAAVKAKQAFEEAKKHADESANRAASDQELLNLGLKQLEEDQKTYRENLATLEGQRSITTTETARLETLKADAVDDFRQGLQDERNAWEQVKADDAEMLKAAERQAADDRRTLQRDRCDFDTDKEMLDEDRANLDQKIERRAQALSALIQQELEISQKKMLAADQAIETLSKELDKYKSERWRGGGDLNELTKRYGELQQSYEGLKDTYAGYPSQSEIVRLRAQDQELQELREQVASLLREKSSFTVKYSRLVQSVGEVEALRDQKESAQAQLKIVRDELRNLTKQIEGEDSRQGTFPTLDRIDQDPKFQSPSAHKKWALTAGLGTFVSDLQQLMWVDGFKYDLFDLRCFVAGMAMSKMHILEGISGTGKTSLPRLFAKCVNAGEKEQGIEVVSVQANWRDKQDLFGYYNSFEKTYRDTAFLRALYEAQTPRYKDAVYIIILDEMNLSRPEQYFADMLGILSGDKEANRVELMPPTVEDVPQLLVNGCEIAIPPNVWFVGTANHDESTLEIADKTYDRSHVLILPNEPKLVEVRESTQTGQLSYTDLQRAFDKAMQGHRSDADKAKLLITKYVEPALREHFKIGIGNRLKQLQLDRFVPVFIEAGGTLSEAVDHLLVTKILRRIEGQHGTEADQFRKFAVQLKAGWTALGVQGKPKRTIDLLDSEAKPKDRGITESVWG